MARLGTQTEWLEHLPFTTNAGADRRARIGIVVLDSDYTVEHELTELWRDVPASSDLYRVFGSEPMCRWIARRNGIDDLRDGGPHSCTGEISVLARVYIGNRGNGRPGFANCCKRPKRKPQPVDRAACTALGARRTPC